MKGLRRLHQHDLVAVKHLIVVQLFVEQANAVAGHHHRHGAAHVQGVFVTTLDQIGSDQTAHGIVYKNNGVALYQLQPGLYRVEACFATRSDLNAAVIKIGINDFAAHIGVFIGQYQHNAQIVVRFQKGFEGIVQHRLAVQEQKLFGQLAAHALTRAACDDDGILVHSKKWTGNVRRKTKTKGRRRKDEKHFYRSVFRFLPSVLAFYLRAMQTDVLIVGQGICGTLLSWWLHKEGKSFLVMDDGAENSASRVAAGIINPVTGRRYVQTWMAEDLLAFAQTTYVELGADLDAVLLYQRNLIDFFPSPQMRSAFIDRIGEDGTYLRTYPDQNRFNESFRYDFGCGEISPVYGINFSLLLSLWRKKLETRNSLREEKFIAEDLQVREDGVIYGSITARKIVFCDGAGGLQNPWFGRLPFSAVKGEALVIECKDLPTDHVFKKGMMLTPMPERDRFWVGSNYQWEFENDEPSEEFLAATTTLLNHWLKKPYRVLQHKAAVRPATLERRPFAGFHPVRNAVGILNGTGTKGASLAPFFAQQLAQHLVHGSPLMPEVDVKRFSRLLSARET